MKDILIKISDDEQNKTVSDILNGLNLTKNAIKNLKFCGSIKVNGNRQTVRCVLHKGDELSLHFDEKNSENIKCVKMPLDIIYEDENLLVLNKPTNMATHPSQNNRENTLANGVMAYYNGNFTFRVLTRLDKYTSGVVLVAKNAVSAVRVAESLKCDNAKKTYYAVLDGTLKNKEDTINCPIDRCENSIIKRCVSPNGKSAQTHYKILKEKNGLSLAEINIKTGRTHQIRVHMSYIGAPVYSDFLYGKEIENKRLCLHCGKVEFSDPFTKKKLSFFAPVPKDMCDLIEI